MNLHTPISNICKEADALKGFLFKACWCFEDKEEIREHLFNLLSNIKIFFNNAPSTLGKKANIMIIAKSGKSYHTVEIMKVASCINHLLYNLHVDSNFRNFSLPMESGRRPCVNGHEIHTFYIGLGQLFTGVSKMLKQVDDYVICQAYINCIQQYRRKTGAKDDKYKKDANDKLADILIMLSFILSKVNMKSYKEFLPLYKFCFEGKGVKIFAAKQLDEIYGNSITIISEEGDHELIICSSAEKFFCINTDTMDKLSQEVERLRIKSVE